MSRFVSQLVDGINKVDQVTTAHINASAAEALSSMVLSDYEKNIGQVVPVHCYRNHEKQRLKSLGVPENLKGGDSQSTKYFFCSQMTCLVSASKETSNVHVYFTDTDQPYLMWSTELEAKYVVKGVVRTKAGYVVIHGVVVDSSNLWYAVCSKKGDTIERPRVTGINRPKVVFTKAFPSTLVVVASDGQCFEVYEISLDKNASVKNRYRHDDLGKGFISAFLTSDNKMVVDTLTDCTVINCDTWKEVCKNSSECTSANKCWSVNTKPDHLYTITEEATYVANEKNTELKRVTNLYWNFRSLHTESNGKGHRKTRFCTDFRTPLPLEWITDRFEIRHVEWGKNIDCLKVWTFDKQGELFYLHLIDVRTN
jgi:TolB-like protein